MILRDKIAIVTGGASGLGQAIAERFVAEGAIVIAADIAVAAESFGKVDRSRPIPYRLNVSDPISVANLVNNTVTEFGHINVLVNSAGIGKDVPFLEHSLEDFDRIIAINLRGTFLIGQAVARHMSGKGGGRIINIASVSGERGNSGRAAYGASKGGVITLSKVMAVDLASYGINVNVIAPSAIETPLTAQMHTPKARLSWVSLTPLNRYGTPAEIAGAAVFLASDDATYITGHVLDVDGGFMAGGIRS